MKSLSARHIFLMALTLPGCAASSRFDGGLNVPANEAAALNPKDKIADGGLSIDNGRREYGFKLDGEMVSSPANTSLLLNLPAPAGRIICKGSFRRSAYMVTLKIPLKCSDGRTGEAQATEWVKQPFTGSGDFHLSDGSWGYFSFGVPAPT